MSGADAEADMERTKEHAGGVKARGGDFFNTEFAEVTESGAAEASYDWACDAGGVEFRAL